jgi:3-octaprenyl-4hydroxybenzoate decarboxylase (EC 4.1.1.-)
VPIDDIRQFTEELEKAGQLKRIKTEVDTNLEIAEILRRVSYTNGPAILFENAKGYEIPVLGNAFGSIKDLRLDLKQQSFLRLDKELLT